MSWFTLEEFQEKFKSYFTKEEINKLYAEIINRDIREYKEKGIKTCNRSGEDENGFRLSND